MHWLELFLTLLFGTGDPPDIKDKNQRAIWLAAALRFAVVAAVIALLVYVGLTALR
jgi:hypothetical protein